MDAKDFRLNDGFTDGSSLFSLQRDQQQQQQRRQYGTADPQSVDELQTHVASALQSLISSFSGTTERINSRSDAVEQQLDNLERQVDSLMSQSLSFIAMTADPPAEILMRISGELAAELQKAFGHLDQDGDGQIGESDLLAAMRAFRVPGASQEMAREWLQYARDGATGTLGYPEFVTRVCRGLTDRTGGERRRTLGQAFQLLAEVQSSGKMVWSASSLANCLTGLGEPTESQLTGWMLAEAVANAQPKVKLVG
uniref:EF-hand domain-containing protein n=1 Tax=Macrostomum lignano TaxID=282301 RepID=A0A1I8H7E3_9PLAT